MRTGQLPPGAAEQLAKSIDSWRKSGQVSGLEVLPPPDCEVAKAFVGKAFPLDHPPLLPVAGCTRSPCCACLYLPVISEPANTKPKGMSSMTKKILAGFGLVWVLVVVTSLLLGGCAGTPFKWADARQIETGMTKPEVTAKLGAPTRVATIQNDATRYVWVWVNTMAGSSRTLVVDFDKAGKVIKAPPIPDEFQD